MRLPLLCLILALAGCKSAPVRYVQSPPEILRVQVPVYVPIPAEMTRRCAWRKSGAPSQVFELAAERKACLEQYEPQLRAVERVQGGPAPTP